MYSDFQFSEAPNMFDGFCDGSDNITLLDEQVFDLSFGTEEGSRILKRCQASGTFDDLQTKSGSDLITEALKDMSSEEQGKIQKELHGIDFDDHKVEEAPDFQDAMLLQMDHELQNLKSISTWSLQLVGIEMAERQNACYVKSRRLLLKFLRCDNWDPAKAASRLIRHFDWKLELFGEGKLTKDISLADLYPQDIKSLKEGYLQRLPERDRAGRAVLCSVYNGQIYHSPNSLARLLMYMANSLDDESDKNGVVLVSFKLTDVRFADNSGLPAFLLLRRVGSVLPIHWCAMHKFLQLNLPGISRVNLLVESAISAFTPETRVRLRLHYGSYTEWMYELMCFGIPHHLIPLTSDFKIKTKNHFDYLAMRKIAENVAPRHDGCIKETDLPSNNDVLLGKGKPIQEFRGNQRLCSMIDDYLHEYDIKSKSEKTALAVEMVNKVKMGNGRFLSKENGLWTEVCEDIARDKVSHMFRHQRQKAQSSKKSTNASDTKNCIRTTRSCASDETHLSEKSLNKRSKLQRSA